MLQFACGLLLSSLAPEPAAAQPRAAYVSAQGKPLDPQREGISPTRTPPPSAEWLAARAALPDDWLQVQASEGLQQLRVQCDAASGAPLSSSYLLRRGGRFEALRPVLDEADRQHVPGVYRSILVPFAGTCSLLLPSGAVAAKLRVTGPYGPAGMLRLRLRAVAFGYPLAMAEAEREALTRALHAGVAPWAQCGIGADPALRWELHAPPPPHLLSLGAGVSGPPAGGLLQFSLDGKPLRVRTLRDEPLSALAARLTEAAAARGYSVQIAANSRAQHHQHGGLDLSFRRADGALASLRAGQPLSTDARLSVQIAALSLRDGVRHFRNIDSSLGTLDERQILRAIWPRARDEVLIALIPRFAGAGGRLGESFARSDMGSLAPAVLITHLGLGAAAGAMTLAHELGHVLLDQPTHPDTHGADTPSALMDADNADASAYGPRRLSRAECDRARRLGVAAGLLVPWSAAR